MITPIMFGMLYSANIFSKWKYALPVALGIHVVAWLAQIYAHKVWTILTLKVILNLTLGYNCLTLGEYMIVD